MATIFRPPTYVAPQPPSKEAAATAQPQGTPYTLRQVVTGSPFKPYESVTYYREPTSRAAVVAQPEGIAPVIRDIRPFIPYEAVTYYREPFSRAAIMAQPLGIPQTPIIPAPQKPFFPYDAVTYYREPFSRAARTAQPEGMSFNVRIEPIPMRPFVSYDAVTYYHEPFSRAAIIAQPTYPFINFLTTTGIPIVFAVDIERNTTTGATIIDGQPAVMIMNVDNEPEGDLSLRFVKPDYSVSYVRSSNLYVGHTTMPSLGFNFLAGQYVVYTFALGELDQRGRWEVELTAGVTTYRAGYFVVT